MIEYPKHAIVFLFVKEVSVMKKYRGLFLAAVVMMLLCFSALTVSAEPTYTWVRTYSDTSGTQEDGFQVMHTTIESSHADGEQNYAEVYCALETPPDSFPADQELALKVKLYGNVIRNDRGRGILMDCDVIVAEPGLDWDATQNAGYSMWPDDYSAMSWGNYTEGGFSDRETVVRRNMSSGSYNAGDEISIYFRTKFGQCEWRYKLEKAESGDDAISGSSAPDADYVVKGNYVYQVKNNKATFFYRTNDNLTKITVPATIKYKGKSIPVAAIQKDAFKGMKKLKTVIIGKNVKKIGKNAFRSCPKLNNITIKTTKLTAKNVGASAFKGISKKAIVKCPKAKKKAYRKILLKKGMKTSVKFKNL